MLRDWNSRPKVVGVKQSRRAIREGRALQVFLATNADPALTGPLDSVKAQCAEYQRRRDALCGGLRAAGWAVPDSHGSMFVWAPLPGGRTDSMAFCEELMDRAGVVVTPGASFGPSGEGYVRMALVMGPERLREAVAAIAASGL